MSAGRLIIVGGGLSGLACAHEALLAGFAPLVLEERAAPGGVVGTLRADGFAFERGPNTIPASAVHFRTLCGELGIAQRLIATDAASDVRYLLVDGRLAAFPLSPPALLASPLLGIRDKLRLLSEPLRAWRAPAEEPDLEQLLTERVGARATRLFAGSFVRGVFAAELAELGAHSAFPRLWDMLVEHRSLVRALWARRKLPATELPGPEAGRRALLSFPGGMQELVDALRARVGERLRCASAVRAIECTPSGYRVATADGQSFATDAVVLAVPAPVAARLLATLADHPVAAPADHPLASVADHPLSALGPLEHLRAVEHARITLVHLGLAADSVRVPPGFGFLVPPPERGAQHADEPLLGVIFASNLFPGRAPPGAVALSCFYAGRDGDEQAAPALVERACRDVARTLGGAHAAGHALRPRTAHAQTWNDVIPRYAVGHRARMHALELALTRAHPALALAGTAQGGISVDDVIAHARAATHALAERLVALRRA